MQIPRSTTGRAGVGDGGGDARSSVRITVLGDLRAAYPLARRFGTLDHRTTVGSPGTSSPTSYLGPARPARGMDRQMSHDGPLRPGERGGRRQLSALGGSWEDRRPLSLDRGHRSTPTRRSPRAMDHHGRFSTSRCLPGRALARSARRGIWQAGPSRRRGPRLRRPQRRRAVFTVAPTTATLRNYVDDIRLGGRTSAATRAAQ